MTPRIETISEKKLLGMQSKMRHNEYGNIVALWKRFMPKQKEIYNTLNQEFIALQIYKDFNALEQPFDILAGVEVLSINAIPEDMISFIIPEGKYAIFLHRGTNASATYQKIMIEWLPNSGFKIDDRPHFQVMGEKYENGSMASEEDFYVPIK